MEPQKVAVIGAGLGGCTIAALLARHGHDVVIYEKNSKVGGRCQSFYLRDQRNQLFRFDLGASMLLMSEVFDKLSKKIGVPLTKDTLGLEECVPSSVVHIHPVDVKKTVEQSKRDNDICLRSIEVTSKFLSNAEKQGIVAPSLSTFLKEGRAYYSFAKSTVLSNNFENCSHLFSFDHLKDVISFIKASGPESLCSLYSYCNKRFQNEVISKALSLQSMYMGLSPYDARGFYSFLAVDEIINGIYYPTKSQEGMSHIPNTLVRIAQQAGAKLCLNTEVRKISTITRGNAEIPVLEISDSNGQRKEVYDKVFCNADLCYAYKHLLDDMENFDVVDQMKYGCTTVSFHWGLDIDLSHLKGAHHVFLGRDFEKSFETIFHERGVPQDISFYFHIPSNVDKSAAPEGCSAVTVLVPIGSQFINKKEILSIKSRVIGRLCLENILDSKNSICREEIYTPQMWGRYFNLHRNCALGLNHNITQLGPFRPANTDPKRPWLYFVGANTQPGCGVPTVIHSAMNTFECFKNDIEKSQSKPAAYYTGWKKLQKLIQHLGKLGVVSTSGSYHI